MSRDKVPFVYTIDNPYIIPNGKSLRPIARELKLGDHIYVSDIRSTYMVKELTVELVKIGLLKSSEEYMQLLEIFGTDEKVTKYLESIKE